MDTRRIILCILCILCTGCSIIKAVTVDVSYSPQPAVLGVSQTRLHCQYTLGQSETFYGLSLHDAQTQGNVIVEMAGIDTNSTVVWAPGAPQNIKDRASIIASPGDRSLDLQFDATRCEDSNNISYRCEVEYQANNIRQIARDNVSIDVEARPKAPEMSVTPTTQNVTEFTEMTFTCSGNVGRPAGSFHWYTFNDDDDRNIDNVTLPATQVNTGPGAESCTIRWTSVLTLNVTRREAGKRLVVRCIVYHPTQGNAASTQCQDPDTDYCATSQQIDVQYPVEVSLSSDAVNVEEGTERTITCNTRGNPLPYLVEWQKEGDNATLSSGNDLTLSNVILNDTGNYVCTAYNTIGTTTRNDSGTVLVTVQETTTPPPTTTPTTTASTTGSDDTGTGQVSKAGDTDNLAIIIPVVVVAVIIIIIIIVAIIIVRKRKTRKEVEEPPEKPFNNHSGLNAAATRPDIVSNAYTSYDNPNGMKNEDGLTYAELQFDNKPRSRRPLAIDDSHTDYSDVSMPQV